jgi:ABC-type hemin transport system ATPase subunit
MTEQEAKLAKIITEYLVLRDRHRIEPEVLAKAIIREMVTDRAFDMLTGGDQPTVQINQQLTRFHQPYRCHCEEPVERCDHKGCRCTLCGYPT